MTNLTLESAIGSSLRVTWDLPKNPNGVIQNYTVIIKNTNPVSDEIVFNVTTKYQNKTFPGLSKFLFLFVHQIVHDCKTFIYYNIGPGVPYSVTVVPVNSAGRGEINMKVGFSKQLGII